MNGACRRPSNFASSPPYSPELNPVEPLWRHLRENYLGNRVFDTLDEVEDSLSVALGQLIRQPETVRSIACFDWLNTPSILPSSNFLFSCEGFS